MRFEFSHKHAYPGCRLRVTEPSEGADDAAGLVEFSDGVVVPARFVRRADAITLHVAPYRTARGTHIVAKSWLLQPDGPGDRWRVRKRLAETPEQRSGT